MPSLQEGVALLRAQMADAWVGKYRAAIYKALDSVLTDAAHRVRDGVHVQLADDFAAKRIYDAKAPLMSKMVALGWIHASHEVPHPIKAMDVDAGFGAEEFVEIRTRTKIEDYIRSTSKMESATTARHYQDILRQAATQGLTPAKSAQLLLNLGVTDNANRADMMARTATIWSFNEGAMLKYAEAGIERMEWLIAYDDVTCEFCLSMEAEANRTTRVGEAFASGSFTGTEGGVMQLPFDIMHPPLHPYCRCTVVPVIETVPVLVRGE